MSGRCTDLSGRQAGKQIMATSCSLSLLHANNILGLPKKKKKKFPGILLFLENILKCQSRDINEGVNISTAH